MKLFKKRKARFRMQLRYMYMSEEGPVIGVYWRPMNFKAYIQKWNYLFVKRLTNQMILLISMEAYLNSIKEQLEQPQPDPIHSTPEKAS